MVPLLAHSAASALSQVEDISTKASRQGTGRPAQLASAREIDAPSRFCTKITSSYKKKWFVQN